MTKLHTAILLLRFLLVALFGALVMFQAVILPGSFGYMAEESPEHAHMKWPLLTVSILGLLCAQVVIVCTWRLLTMVEDDRIFTEASGTWADAIVVMEKQHRNKIRERFPKWYEKKPIVCLYIDDVYDYMQPELIAVLKEKSDTYRTEDVWRRGLLG